ncbi:MAG: hypothetical protein VYC21_02595 [Bacteroidota bacterium]|nr:hypothetical protein [Bacteroidota bacterium]
MNKKSLVELLVQTFFLFTFLNSYTQVRTHTLSKISPEKIKIDGIITDEEIEVSKIFNLDNEISPGYNIPSTYKTLGYMLYTDKFLYVGYRAFRDQVKTSVLPRDDFKMFTSGQDMVSIQIDAFGDARNWVGLVANALGSQLDASRIEPRGVGQGPDAEGWSAESNYDYETAGRVTDFGYEVEFKIPFSSISFPNSKNQKWKIRLTTRYIENNRQGVFVESNTSRLDRDNACKLCQLDDEIIMNDIEIEKSFNLLPYISSNISGSRDNYNEKLNYSNPELNYGLGLNIDITKNVSFEATLNPDFSQVEADVTQIDVNSPTALNYPEQRPFFNRGIRSLDFSLDVFYSRSINNPVFASKVIAQPSKSKILILTAIDDDTPILVPTKYKSFSGVGSKSFNNVIRYQNVISQNAEIGLTSLYKKFNEGGFNNVIGTDGLFTFSKFWKFEYGLFYNSSKESIADWIDTDEKFSNYTVNLDGESFNGSALYTTLRRDTENWSTRIRYFDISPEFRSDLGFIVENNLKRISFFQGYTNYLNKDIIKRISLSSRYELEYDYSNNYTDSKIEGYFTIASVLDSTLFYNYEYNFLNSYLDKEFRNYDNHRFTLNFKPYKFVDVISGFSFGKDIAFREEIPDLGQRLNYNLTLDFTLTDNFSIKPSINYSKLRKIQSDEYFFNGYISRLDIRYQFTSFLGVRFISEYNNFSEELFFQPLISWRPNADTIFYLGGNQNMVNEFLDYNSPHYRTNSTQLFLKFQYLIKP